MQTANLGFGGTEDKSLGVYFATDNDLDDAERFAEKVLKYLWDDAFKLGRKELFNDCSQGLSAVIEAYEDAKGDPLKRYWCPRFTTRCRRRWLKWQQSRLKLRKQRHPRKKQRRALQKIIRLKNRQARSEHLAQGQMPYQHQQKNRYLCRPGI